MTEQLLQEMASLRLDATVRQREHSVNEASKVQIGRNNEKVIGVKFRNAGLYSLMNVNAGSSQGIQLRPGQEEVFSVPWPYTLRMSFQVNYSYENQNPILADGSRVPTTPTGTSADAIHLGVITEIVLL